MATISIFSNNQKQKQFDNISPENIYPVKTIKKIPIPLPQALLPSKFIQHPSGLSSVLHATTNQPPTTGFNAKYGLKPPSLLEGVFQEYVHPQTVQATKPTKSPFKSIIKVPSAIDIHGDFSVKSSDQRNQVETSKKHILSLEVPSFILSNLDQHSTSPYDRKTTLSNMDATLSQKMGEHSYQNDELAALHEENAILNTLIRKLVIEEVENLGHTKHVDKNDKAHSYENHKTQHYDPNQSQVEILVAAVKDNADLLTRIQGLRNLKNG